MRGFHESPFIALLGLRGGGVLLALLVLPLYVAVLILGAVDVAAAWLASAGRLLLIIALVFAPWAIAVALRVSIE